MTPPDLTVSRALLPLLDASPSPYHAVATAAERLLAAGFREIGGDEGLAPGGRGPAFLRHGGALVAWVVADHHTASSGVRVAGAHTDSPNLRIKPQPEHVSAGWHQLGVEVYGGVLLNSWLDRDLGLSGRVAVSTGSGVEVRLVRDDRPLLRIPQLAIHLHREINEQGLLLDRQRHMAPMWAAGGDGPDLRHHLAGLVDAAPDSIVTWDLMLHDLTPAALTGLDEQFLSSGRIDNLLSCFLGIEALIEVAPAPGPSVPMVCLFDHEEVGSVSTTGAASPLLADVVDRLGAALGGDLEDRARSRSASLVVSADGAHATHPNYADRHEPDHRIAVNGGPVLKINANQRYATDAATGAWFARACEAVGAPLQRFVNRTDLACGSTIGPLSAGQLGMPVVDAGVAQLAMHSARETCGSHDPAWFRAVLVELLAG